MDRKPATREDIPLDADSLIRFGTVLSVDVAAGRCTVQIGDADSDGSTAIETPPIRWLAGRAGKTRIWSPPSEGEQCIVVSPSAELGNAIAVMGISSDDFPPAGNSAIDLIDFADGSQVKYDAQAKHLTIDLASGAQATINAPEGVTINADVSITGNVSVDGEITSTGDMTADGISQINHKHGDVQSGTSQTGKPL